MRTNWGCLFSGLGALTVWGLIIGFGGFGFFVRVFVILSVGSVLGAGIGWMWRKLGGSVNE